MLRTKIAIFDLTGCEGCEFHLLSLNEHLLDFFQDFEVVNWRLLTEEQRADFDIAFIEGAVTTPYDIELLKKIRATSKIVVAIGACAINGNVFATLNPKQRKKLAAKLYDKKYRLTAEFLEPVEKFIPVDEKIPGCPPDLSLFKQFLVKLKTLTITSKKEAVTPPDYTAKIEGHGVLKINFAKETATFTVVESERLVEGLLEGKNFAQAANIVARICGICPIAHNLCCWAAIENALNISPSEETIILRRILLSAQIIKSHLLHLFFLVLPGLADVRGSIELSTRYPSEFHFMLNIKRFADKTLEIIGGSDAFPTNTTLAGFIKIPTMTQLLPIQDLIAEVVDEARDFINLFASFEIPPLKSQSILTTTEPPDVAYPLYPGIFPKTIREIVKKTSTAKLGVLENGEIIKTGAMARLSRFGSLLNPCAKKAFKKTALDFANPFTNNLAQAIEIMHFLEEINTSIERLGEMNLDNAQGIKNIQKYSLQASGQATLEAPRGILIHQVRLSEEGKITNYNIIPPTQLNLASLEKEVRVLLPTLFGKPRRKQRKILEQLIRAYDPCITCAVH